jgi:lipoprotein-releasing system permease protein
MRLGNGVGVSALIGARYFRAGRSGGFLSFISAISLFGVALGVVALIVVVSVMNGFERELKQRILGAVPHGTIFGNQAALGAAQAMLESDARVLGVARYSERQALLVAGRDHQLALIQGIEPAKPAALGALARDVADGQLGTGPRIVLGEGIAFRLGVFPGDHLLMVLPEASAGGQTVTPRLFETVVGGHFRLHSELDHRLALMHVDQLPAARVGLRYQVSDVFAVSAISPELRLIAGLEVRDWRDEFGDFFRTVQMEKVMMFLLLTLVVAIAAFNIVSTLSIMVDDRRDEIAVLRTLGASRVQTTMIFVVQGGATGAIGTLLGTVIGVPLAIFIPEVVAFFEAMFQSRVLAGTYFDSVPSDVRGADIGVVISLSLAISLLASVYPSLRAARVNPAEELRYE